MDKSENVMDFIASYSPEHNQMSPEALEELKGVMMSFLDMDDNQQLIEFSLQNLIESSRDQLETYSKYYFTTDISVPSQRNLKNDLEVIERLVAAVNGEKIQKGGHDVTELLKTIAEFEKEHIEHMGL